MMFSGLDIFFVCDAILSFYLQIVDLDFFLSWRFLLENWVLDYFFFFF